MATLAATRETMTKDSGFNIEDISQPAPRSSWQGCQRSLDPRSETVNTAWLLENPGFVSGGNLRWWRDQFAVEERRNEEKGLGDAYDQLSEEAHRSPRGATG
jgi:hypothetical protein